MTADDRKLVSIVVPCFNEVGNVRLMAKALCLQMSELPAYDFEVIFIDNCSTDGTREELREICSAMPKVKAILNSRNFGQFNSPYYGLCQTKGDCAIAISCDFQDPVELIPQMLKVWDDGSKIVCPIKTESEENGFVYFVRSCYYRLIRKLSTVEQIEHFTGFGLYDRSFIDVMRKLDDPTPFLRGIVAELGPASRTEIPYRQHERKTGKSHNNFWILYDAAMLSFTGYTKAPIRISVVLGSVGFILSLVAFFLYIMAVGSGFASLNLSDCLSLLLIALMFLSFVSIGLLGEYVLAINLRSMKRPLVVEQERVGDWDNRAEAIS